MIFKFHLQFVIFLVLNNSSEAKKSLNKKIIILLLYEQKRVSYFVFKILFLWYFVLITQNTFWKTNKSLHIWKYFWENYFVFCTRFFLYFEQVCSYRDFIWSELRPLKMPKNHLKIHSRNRQYKSEFHAGAFCPGPGRANPRLDICTQQQMINITLPRHKLVSI